MLYADDTVIIGKTECKVQTSWYSACEHHFILMMNAHNLASNVVIWGTEFDELELLDHNLRTHWLLSDDSRLVFHITFHVQDLWLPGMT